MSFVAEILSSAAKVETENLNKKIPEITSAIIGYKQNVLQYCDKVYVKFSEKPKNNLVLLKRATELSNSISQLEETVNNVTNNEVDTCSSKIIAYKQELEESSFALLIASTLIQVHEALLCMKTCILNKNYIEGVDLIHKVNQLLDNCDIQSIDAFNGLKENFNSINGHLISEINEEFKVCVQYNKNKPYTFSLKMGNHIRDVLLALGLANSRLDLLDEFTNFLWEFILCPTIIYKVSIDTIENDEDSILSLHIINENDKGNYKEVFDNIRSIIKFLNNNFNYELGNNMTTLIYIGNLISDKLSDHIIKNCLSDIIPKNSEELQKYKNVTEDVQCLQKELFEYTIFPAEMDALSKYTNGVELHFINKKCQEYIISAREIMKKDLHEMVVVGDETNALNNSSNTFPQCSISRSTIDLFDLTIKIMENGKMYQVDAEKLYSTVQDIFDTYGEIIQNYHQKLLQTIPQQVALFHNNCMFLSYKISTSIEDYYLPSVPSSDPVLFIEKANLLKQLGNKIFIECLEQQINQIEEIMKESGLTSINVLNKLDPKIEKSLRQCLRQQELLKTVWHKVLSYLDYNRSIGCILNFLCNFIISELLKIEDISSEAGDQLLDIFKVILTRGPKLFIDSKDIHLYVKNWYKFNELVFIFSSNLTEICDRWADGKGPLALQFKPEEVQNLIRALFQNTDRRAAVLARILK